MTAAVTCWPLSISDVLVTVRFRWLLDHGETPNSLNMLLESGIVQSPLAEPVSAHEDETTWLVRCNRSEAERMLHGKPEGTFLIRPSSDPHSYALSIV